MNTRLSDRAVRSHNRAVAILFLLFFAAVVVLAMAVPGCPSNRERGPGWKLHEHGDPQVGPGPKNPNGKSK